MHIEVMSNGNNKFLSPRQLLAKYSQNPTTASKHFQASLSVLGTFKGLEFKSVKYKHF